MSFTRDELIKHFDYDVEGGRIFWKTRATEFFPSEVAARRWNSKHAGKEAGYISTQPTGLQYRRVVLFGKAYRTHHLIWVIHLGHWPEKEIDHIDGDGLNNWIGNLRCVDRATNSRNRRMSRNNSSGVTGVSWHERDSRYMARLKVNGRLIHIGSFKTLEEARIAREKAIEGLGYTARHGK